MPPKRHITQNRAKTPEAEGDMTDQILSDEEIDDLDLRDDDDSFNSLVRHARALRARDDDAERRIEKLEGQVARFDKALDRSVKIGMAAQERAERAERERDEARRGRSNG